jgi:hypothetical protein
LKTKSTWKNGPQNLHSAGVMGRILKTLGLSESIDLERAKGSSEDEPFHR